MNKDRLLQVANDLRHEDKVLKAGLAFNMSTFGDNQYTSYWRQALNGVQHRLGLDEAPECNTVACIAGWGVVRARGLKEYHQILDVVESGDAEDEYGEYDEEHHIEGIARRWFDIDEDTAAELFRSSTGSDITAKKAATVIENLVLTGEVNWKVPVSDTPLIAAGLKRVA